MGTVPRAEPVARGRRGYGRGVSDDWTTRVDAVWAEFDDLPEDEVVRRIDELAAERPEGDALALFERAGSRDSVGREQEAETLYRAALEAGLPSYEEARATIQLASTIRNLDRAEESAAMLAAWLRTHSDHELAVAGAAFLALSLASTGRPADGLTELLRAVAPTLPRYQRSVRAYADELAGRVGPA